MEMIPNLNVMQEVERKRTVLTSSRKRAEILSHLNGKHIVLLLSNLLVCPV